jgi:hypothetical protein
MQLGGLLRFTHWIFPACNNGDWHFEMSRPLEAIGRGNHQRCFGRGSPDLRWTQSHLFRKACNWGQFGPKILRKKAIKSPRIGEIVWLKTSPTNGSWRR